MVPILFNGIYIYILWVVLSDVRNLFVYGSSAGKLRTRALVRYQLSIHISYQPQVATDDDNYDVRDNSAELFQFFRSGFCISAVFLVGFLPLPPVNR